jgi:hypothetical protein
MAYLTVQDLRNEGLENPPYSNAWIMERIKLAQAAFEKLTGKYFEVRVGETMLLDGTGHGWLPLPVPPVAVGAIDSVKIDGDVLDADEYKVVMPYPDGRMSPALYYISGTWPKDVQNIEITGDFGFVDSDGGSPPVYSTPIPVKHAVKRIVLLEMPKLGDAEGQRASQIIEESLGNYSYRLSEVQSGRSLFGDDRIDDVIRLFKGTKMVAV